MLQLYQLLRVHPTFVPAVIFSVVQYKRRYPTKLPIVFTIRSSISTTPVLKINCAISIENVVKTDKPIALYMQNVF